MHQGKGAFADSPLLLGIGPAWSCGLAGLLVTEFDVIGGHGGLLQANRPTKEKAQKSLPTDDYLMSILWVVGYCGMAPLLPLTSPPEPVGEPHPEA